MCKLALGPDVKCKTFISMKIKVKKKKVCKTLTFNANTCPKCGMSLFCFT